MRREIGSEFWKVETEKENNFFPDETIWFSSGRTALRAIIKDIRINHKVKTVSLPSWCCDSMIIPFVEEGLDVLFYPVYFENGKLKQDINKDTDIIFVMDYFGYSSDLTVENVKKIVIRDLTHSVFSKKYDDADYYFGSLRKWTGIYTGGFALKNGSWNINLDFSATDNCYISLRKQGMKQKAKYMLGEYENKDFLKIFHEAEVYLDTTKDITVGYSEDILKSKTLDINLIRKKRQENAKFLLENIKFDKNIQPIFTEFKNGDVPLFVPILVNDRNQLRKKLIDSSIYCPVHWGVSIHHDLNQVENYIYNHEISIVCDQRYDIDDMQRICDVINEWRD